MGKRKSITRGDQAFRKVIKNSIDTMYRRMRSMLETVEEGAHMDEDTHADTIIRNIWSIEEEWIIDEELRDQLTLIHLEDDEDNNDDN